MIEAVFLEDLKSRAVEVCRNNPFIECITEDTSNTIETTYKDTTSGEYKTIQSKYVIGCDGAHSQVRKSMQGVNMVGESGKAVWGVLDGQISIPDCCFLIMIRDIGVLETDFPDIWSKTFIHSESAGTLLSIPRERNMTRFYIELHPGTTEQISDDVASQDFVMKRAKEILYSYQVEWKSIGMSSWSFSNHAYTTQNGSPFTASINASRPPSSLAPTTSFSLATPPTPTRPKPRKA
jgi:phenol 2-monooxygenase